MTGLLDLAKKAGIPAQAMLQLPQREAPRAPLQAESA